MWGDNSFMSAILPINLDDLLQCRGVESERVEFKASWDPDTTGPQVLRTICAFANDYHNLNGGYIVIGVAEADGRAKLPPAGLSAAQVEAAQQWIRGNCNRLDPPYPPFCRLKRSGIVSSWWCGLRQARCDPIEPLTPPGGRAATGFVSAPRPSMPSSGAT